MAAREAELEPPPRKKRKIPRRKVVFETLAAQPTLDLLPDSIVLNIMVLLDVRSLLCLAQVCRRFYHLHFDECAWHDVDLSTVVTKLDVRKLKTLIHHQFPPTLRRIRIVSRFNKKQVVNSNAIDELFTKCPHIEAIILENCDLSEFPSGCKLFHSPELQHLALVRCVVAYQWMAAVGPSWPSLTTLDLSHSVKTSDSDLEYIASCKDLAENVRSLSLQHCYRVTNKGLKAVCESFSNLRTLNIDCESLTQDCVESITQLKKLQNLTLAKKMWPIRDKLSEFLPDLKYSMNGTSSDGGSTVLATVVDSTDVDQSSDS